MIRFKYILVILLLIFFSSMSLAAETKKKPPVVPAKEDFIKKVEVGFLFGPRTPQFEFSNSTSGSYNAHWHDYSYLTGYWIGYDINGSFSSSIAGDSERSFGFGGFFNYFFRKNVGFQFMLERSRHDVPVGASHGVDTSLHMDWGDRYYYSAEPSIDATTGSLTVMPISFNGLVRYDATEDISGYASGGLTYFKTNIKAESRAGYGYPFVWYYTDYRLDLLLYDSVLVPVSIDDSISGAGINVGGGVVYQILKKVGIVADFRYYLGPKKDIYWAPTPGDYRLLVIDTFLREFGEDAWHGPVNIRLTQSDIDTFMEDYGELFRVEVNPSFFRFAFGIQYRF